MNYLENIKKRCLMNTSIKGNRISAYYLPDMMRLCKHFPLWTNVLSSIFKSPYKIASSAIIENDFRVENANIEI